MLYTENLEELIFHRHEILNADEFIALSGYLGPKPVERLRELPFNSRVIYGMYGAEGIKAGLHNSLTEIQNNVGNLNIYYSQLPVHSKCYAWRRRGEIIHALIGSANFSVNGLTTPYREVLAETTFDTFAPLNTYINHVLNNSISCLEVGTIKIIESNLRLDVCRISLLDNNGEVQDSSGLNWGQSPRSHTNLNDACIVIRVPHIKNYPNLFQPKQLNPLIPDFRGRNRRQNDAIEIIWDEGLIMEGLLEGTQPINGLIYPKQLSSFPSKATMGEYIRNRIRVPLGQPVRRHHLERYGRTHIDVSLVGEGVYQFDFSV